MAFRKICVTCTAESAGADLLLSLQQSAPRVGGDLACRHVARQESILPSIFIIEAAFILRASVATPTVHLRTPANEQGTNKPGLNLVY